MATNQPAIVGDSFELGYRFQRYWTGSMAAAFFFGELGAGIFIISWLYGVTWGMVAGLVATGIIKPYLHLSHMGVPMRSWRAIARPDRSWLSRGMIAIGIFVTFGTAHVILQSHVLAGQAAGGITGDAVATVAVLAALGVMLYHGLAMSHSTAISLWSTGLMPIASAAYAFLGGAAVTDVLARGGAAAGLPSLPALTLVLLAVTGMVLLILVHGALNGPPGARVSMNLLLKGPFSRTFIPLVVGAGLLLPLALLLWAPDSGATSLLVAASVLTGYLAFRTLIFKAALYDPVIRFAPGRGSV